jgi:transposase
MRCHANARLSPIGRQLLVDRIERDGWTVQNAAESAGISPRTARKWLTRFKAEGPAGLLDRSSAPKTVANRSPSWLVEAICAQRTPCFEPTLAQRCVASAAFTRKEQGRESVGVACATPSD